MPLIATRASAAYGAGFSAVTTIPFSVAGSFYAIGSVVVSSPTSSVSFTNIPTDYKNLHIRVRHLYEGSGSNMVVDVNGTRVTRSHYMYGISGNAAGTDTSAIISFQAGTTSTEWATGIYDILDYSSDSKRKTLYGKVGHQRSSGGYSGVVSGYISTTAPIHSLTFGYGGGNFIADTTFALYGEM